MSDIAGSKPIAKDKPAIVAVFDLQSYCFFRSLPTITPIFDSRPAISISKEVRDKKADWSYPSTPMQSYSPSPP